MVLLNKPEVGGAQNRNLFYFFSLPLKDTYDGLEFFCPLSWTEVHCGLG